LLKAGGSSGLDRLVGLQEYSDFAALYRRFVGQTVDANQKKQMIQKFVRRIDVGTDSVKIHFIVDKDHYARELKLAEVRGAPGQNQAVAAPKFFRNVGSNTLTIGDSTRTRTSISSLGN
jgi:hypothetical protein